MENNKDFIVCFRHAGFQLIPDKKGFKTLFAEKFVEPVNNQIAGKPSLTLQGSLEIDSTATEPEVDQAPVVQADPSDTDPMELPYIYVKNVNAKFYEEYFSRQHHSFSKVGTKVGLRTSSFLKNITPTEKLR